MLSSQQHSERSMLMVQASFDGLGVDRSRRGSFQVVKMGHHPHPHPKRSLLSTHYHGGYSLGPEYLDEWLKNHIAPQRIQERLGRILSDPSHLQTWFQTRRP